MIITNKILFIILLFIILFYPFISIAASSSFSCSPYFPAVSCSDILSVSIDWSYYGRILRIYHLTHVSNNYYIEFLEIPYKPGGLISGSFHYTKSAVTSDLFNTIEKKLQPTDSYNIFTNDDFVIQFGAGVFISKCDDIYSYFPYMFSVSEKCEQRRYTPDGFLDVILRHMQEARYASYPSVYPFSEAIRHSTQLLNQSLNFFSNDNYKGGNYRNSILLSLFLFGETNMTYDKIRDIKTMFYLISGALDWKTDRIGKLVKNVLTEDIKSKQQIEFMQRFLKRARNYSDDILCILKLSDVLTVIRNKIKKATIQFDTELNSIDKIEESIKMIEERYTKMDCEKVKKHELIN